jgi:hypothetical protein
LDFLTTMLELAWKVVYKLILGYVIVIVFAIWPKVVGSNPAKDDGLLRAIKIRSTTSSRGEVKPSTPCHKVHGMLNIPAEYDTDTSSAKFKNISRQIPA